MKQIQKKCDTIENGTKQTSITMKQTFIGMKHAQKEPFSEQSPSKKEPKKQVFFLSPQGMK
jgi:hypothetical protein